MAAKIYFICFMYWYMLKAKLITWFQWSRPLAPKKSVLYLCAFFPDNAGYEWRVAKWAEQLQLHGYTVDIAYCVEKEDYDAYEDNPISFLINFLRARFRQVLKAKNYETVIVRRELLPYNDYGNHFLEKLLRKQCANLILDFDDDLAAAKEQPKVVASLFGKILLEDGNSFRNSFKYYDGFYVASNYLKCYVSAITSSTATKIEVIPTCVDYTKYTAKHYQVREQYRLGWIGNTSNFNLVQSIVPYLNALYLKTPFEFVVISKDCAFENAVFPVVYKDWSLETEVEDLRGIDIGLMPLNETEESKGKGGFKLIQYMGLGIVGVASAITINTEIVENGVNSFLIYNDSEWGDVLEKLLKHEINLEKIGANARERIASNYTFEANMDAYLRLLK